MPTTTTSRPLDANLAALGERNADVAATLRRASPPAGLEFADSTHGALTATLHGRQLASRHQPIEEGRRLAGTIDLVEHATVIVLGFGLGWHVRALAERMRKTGLIIVFEPDVGLLRAALERIDHSGWMRDSLLIFVTDAEDRAGLSAKLNGAESILAQGATFLEHPPSAERISQRAARFSEQFADHIASAKTTLLTTLVRSVDSVRNLLHNADHYVGGAGAAELRDAAKDRLAVVVSAGPSLQKNIHRLAEPGVRDRCVIIAVQTTLKPLLEAGVRPHYVTALDYHQISKRFYEGLTAADVEGVTLVADPKAHPEIIDAFPGAVRCCASGFLDRVLGDLKRDMGELPGGATVAHLAVYLAHHLGCNPIAMIGQDLGFPDGLYYAPGTAIHDVWSPELNPFNTIVMMEWQRIVRHRTHLKKVADVHGRSIFTDAQMETYLRQFERDFAGYVSEGLEIIDATEGGTAKQHTKTMTLRETLDRYALEPLPGLPTVTLELDRERLRKADRRFGDVMRRVAEMREISRKTVNVLRKMIADQADPDRMKRHFERIDAYRKKVDERFETFELLNYLNQLGAFKRLKADRRLHMQRDLAPLDRQRAELDRDLANVTWLLDAADEMIAQLDEAQRVLRGERVAMRPRPIKVEDVIDGEGRKQKPIRQRIAALVPIDPERDGLGRMRSLADSIGGRSVLQVTLERLGRISKLESIILIAPRSFDVEALIDQNSIGKPIEIERCDGSPFGPEHEAIIAARRWAETCWRGGIGGMSIHDEVLCPRIMQRVMSERGLTAALLAAPDWPLIDVSRESGCAAVIDRYLEHPDKHRIVFTQAPPGLCGCLVSAELMAQLAERTRLATIGALLVYQPHAPQADPIAVDANVQIEHTMRRGLDRLTFDSARSRRAIAKIIEDAPETVDDPASLVQSVGTIESETVRDAPQQVVLELTTRRLSRGVFHHHPCGSIERPDLPIESAERIVEQIASLDDCVLTLDGLGDPLLHEHFDRIISLAKDSGVSAIHVRTELRADEPTLLRLLESGVDVISIDLHADRGATYETMMGADDFKRVLLNMQYVIDRRRLLDESMGAAGFAMPWIVPRLQRRAATYEDINSFFDRWQHLLGAVVIEAPPPFERSDAWPGDALVEAVTPPRVMHRELRRRMTIHSDGNVPIGELDLRGERCAGNIIDSSLFDIWRDLQNERLELMRSLPPDSPELRTLRP